MHITPFKALDLNTKTMLMDEAANHVQANTDAHCNIKYAEFSEVAERDMFGTGHCLYNSLLAYE